jgi:hypothetical protein
MRDGIVGEAFMFTGTTASVAAHAHHQTIPSEGIVIMTTLQDIRGNPLSGANHAAAAAYMEGLGQLNLYVGDPVASAEAATAEAPGFVMGHVLRAWRGDGAG